MKNILLVIIVVILIGAGGWVLWKNQKPKSNTPGVSEASKFQEVKTDLQNGVEVVVKIKPQVCDEFCENEAAFEVSLTTHEGDLSLDLVRVSTLEVDGKILQAKSWDGGSGGHHLNGTLTFPAIDQEPAKMILRMENIAGVNRTFTWE